MLHVAKKRNRSVSESASGEDVRTSRERRLSGGSSTVTLPTTNSESSNAQKSRLEPVNSQFRNRASSFGSGRLTSYPRRWNDPTTSSSSSSTSQRDLNKQQPRSRHNSGSCMKSHEVVSKSQVTARDRTQSSSKPETSKFVTMKVENSSSSSQKWESQLWRGDEARINFSSLSYCTKARGSVSCRFRRWNGVLRNVCCENVEWQYYTVRNDAPTKVWKGKTQESPILAITKIVVAVYKHPQNVNAQH